ncbi:haloacid dehalogenase-like hydrolase domain-containing protein 2 [Venturia canescens]|uniref:haloacid dehalogenase-like hydrolase domain-containing protein 2 n=1 Tax=Venturia canescens TaxID=32260 RepID=UPI001C9CC77F|nr:haloacid dehalogenase-like hydrolase domain-containing protein 2 [Venturia canescens]
MVKKIKAVLIDLSGTLHIENTVILGAVEALKRLRQTNAIIKFVTNTTKESKSYLHNRLTQLGFHINQDEIFSSLAAARELILNRNLNPLLLIDTAAMEDFEDLKKSDSDLNAVVVGLAPEKFHYEELNQAFRLLINGASLVAIHEGRYYKRSDGLALGPGAFIKGLEYSAGVKALVVGKPKEEFFLAALKNINPQEAIMIGDDVRDDVAGSQAAGLRGILVKTGKYREGDENTISPRPYKTCESFVEAIDSIIEEIH